jgi:hypothetical protein
MVDRSLWVVLSRVPLITPGELGLGRKQLLCVAAGGARLGYDDLSDQPIRCNETVDPLTERDPIAGDDGVASRRARISACAAGPWAIPGDSALAAAPPWSDDD